MNYAILDVILFNIKISYKPKIYPGKENFHLSILYFKIITLIPLDVVTKTLVYVLEVTIKAYTMRFIIFFLYMN